VEDYLESEKYQLKFYFGAMDPVELERAKQEALNDIKNEERNQN
jgi:hypothetical protein